ncbi:hypothetical protein AJ79_01845 [Helicocarpus griseus UAMH5409]|uniref:Uncharacterized protein n=1 Tax=Helicocarpus griseus UAMH5409 TaxID=1447875 RepID=A0A2B7Y490_9EURO|nr:hypothetical protein AJ79_01845 [Helicocarpus griseus UAMH5409]
MSSHHQTTIFAYPASTEVVYAGPAIIPQIEDDLPTRRRFKRQRRIEGSSESDDKPVILGDNEIQNQDYRCGGPMLVALPVETTFLKPTNPLRVEWDEKLEQEAFRILEKWAVRKTGSAQKVNTIMVLVKPTTRYDWVSVRERLIGILDFHQQPSVAIEVRRGEIFQNDDDQIAISADDLVQKSKFGGSIALHDNPESSATLGGFLELLLNGQWKRFGVTNFHCVTPGSTPNQHWETNTLRVDHPSIGDIEEFIAAQEEEIKTSQAGVSKVTDEIAQPILKDDPGGEPRVKMTYRLDKTNLEKAQADLDQARDFLKARKGMLRRVFAVSGYRVNAKGMLLNWALIEILPDRIGDNMLPTGDEVWSYRKIFKPQKSYVGKTASLEEDLRSLRGGGAPILREDG